MDVDFSQTGAAAWRRNALRCVVAIPVKDEAERLPGCLAALAAQSDRRGRPLDRQSFGVVVFANNCRDESASLAREIGERLSLPLRVVEATLPPQFAHAGRARREAMDAAERWLAAAGKRDGVILTTDADSQVSPTWIADNLAAVAAGVDAVLGAIRLDEEGDRLPETLHRRGRLESAYEALLTETSALIDPIRHDPWPHHSTISGASLAIRQPVYLAIGGLPIVPLGEDKALVAALSRFDARIRHADEVVVVTSGRCEGRAPGGVADTLKLRSADPTALCDEALEPYRTAFLRANWRKALRRVWPSRDLFALAAWPKALLAPEEGIQRALAAATFGAAWEQIEAYSPRLRRHALAPAALPRQIALAERTVRRLRGVASAARQKIEAKVQMSDRALDAAMIADIGDE